MTVVDLTRWRIIATLDVAGDAHGLQLDPTGERLYVSDQSSGSLSVIDLETRQVQAQVAVGTLTDGLAGGPAAPDGLSPRAEAKARERNPSNEHEEHGHD